MNNLFELSLKTQLPFKRLRRWEKISSKLSAIDLRLALSSGGGKRARAVFYGCNTGYDPDGSQASWTTRVSALSNFANVDVVGQTSTTYSSMYTNYRDKGSKSDKYIISDKDGKVVFYRAYQVGSVRKVNDWNGNEQNIVNPVRHSTNGKGKVGGYLPGDQKQ